MGAKDHHHHRLPLIRAALVAVVVAGALALAGPAGTSPSAAEGLPLARRLAAALASPELDPARTSAVAADISTGEVVFTRNARRALAPASTEKLSVTFAALRLLGPGYRFRTEVVGDGLLDGRTWKGSITLVGLGDPTLERADLRGLARRIAGLGIRRITGDVIADARFYDARRTAPGWRPSFLGIESAPLSALTVDRDGLTREGPEVAAAARLIASLSLAGVAVQGRARLGTAPPNGLPLAEDLSDPLAAVLRAMNRDSDNFLAEMTLKQLGAVILDRGTTAAGAALVRRELRRSGIPLDGVRILDGSGLSLGDRTTSACLVALLRAAHADPAIRGAFVGSLAIAGVAGTLEDRLARRPTFARVVAKTGTTNRASALAGYVRKRYVFSVLHNGSPVDPDAARAAQDRFVTVLASS